jgi:hypothetical protein
MGVGTHTYGNRYLVHTIVTCLDQCETSLIFTRTLPVVTEHKRAQLLSSSGENMLFMFSDSGKSPGIYW